MKMLVAAAVGEGGCSGGDFGVVGGGGDVGVGGGGGCASRNGVRFDQ